MTTKEDFKSGFAGIVGPTNSGKSTLMNALLGKKLSIVSPKVQTTYHGVRGVMTTKDEQMILTDTPGFQSHPESVARILNKVADKNANDCDFLVWVFDASRPDPLADIERFEKKIRALKPQDKSMCVLNKVDKVRKDILLPLLQKLAEKEMFCELIPISALKINGVDRVKAAIKAHLPQGQQLYPDGTFTDRPQDFVVSEFIREKIYRATHEEIPYSAWVEIEEAPLQEEAKTPTIRAKIHVDSDSRKAILIGKGGEMLKRIGTQARKDIESYLGYHICLKLHVDVHAQWKEDSRHLNRYLELN